MAEAIDVLLIHPGDDIVSNAKIEASGCQPAYTLKNGIRELVKGYQILRNSRHVTA